MFQIARAAIAASLLFAFAAVLSNASPVSAHERRQVGDIWMVVGFLSEPAFLNGQNGLDLTVYKLKPGVDPAKQTSADRDPITGLEKTLQAEVIKDGQTMPLTLTARFNVPGAYNGVFFPTAAGPYTFHITGDVNGQKVDEKFTSGNGFNSVEDVNALQFPVKIGTTQDLKAAVDDAGDDSPVPLILAIVAVVLGAGGLALGGVALARSRSRSGTA